MPPIFWDRVWENHKGTESHAFKTADALTLNHQYMKETVPNSYILTAAITREEAIGYTVGLPRAGVPAGTEVELMLGEWDHPITGAGSGSVITVSDDGNLVVVVDNTDPQNPVITFQGVFVAMSIVGTGQNGNPLTLDNDQLSPGALQCYSTDAGGNKGWFPLPNSGDVTLTDNGGGSYTFDNNVDPPVTFQVGDTITAFSWNSTTGDLTITTNNGPFTVIIPKVTVTDNGDGTFTFDNGIDPNVTWNTLNGLLSLNSVQGDGLLGSEFQLVGDVLAPGNNYYYGTNGAGVKGFYLLPPPGIADILIGNTLFVDAVYGDDGTGAPNSLAFKYLTIEGARAASVPGDLIHIFPGVYVLTTQMHMDGSQAFDFYCEPGVTIQSAVGAPAIMLYPINKFRWKGWADFDWWDGNSPFWDNSDTASGQSLVEFEFNTIVFSLEFGTPGTQVFAYLYSQIGYIAGNFVKDMQFNAPGWQWYQIGIDKFDNVDMNISAFFFADFLSNDGINFVGTIARTNISGRNNDKCEIRRGTQPGIFIEEGGLADYRHIQIKADLIVNSSVGMECRSGTIDHWGNIEATINDGGGSTLTPCIKFTETIGRSTMIYTHHEGRMTNTENAVVSGDKAGKFTFKGDYRNASEESFATFEWHSSGGVTGIGAYLFFDGNFRNDSTNPIFRINEDLSQDTIKQTFLTVTAQGASAGSLMDNTVYGTPLDIFVVHSLVTNVNPLVTVNDLSTGNRWYTDTGLDMGL